MLCNKTVMGCMIEISSSLACFLFIVYSSSVYATENKEEMPSLWGQGQKIEFAFVLLPDEEGSRQAEEVGLNVAAEVQRYSLEKSDPTRKNSYNSPLRLPHVSIGQYGLEEKELSILYDILREAVRRYSPFNEAISHNLSVTEENIFLDFEGIYEKTNPQIIDLFLFLRKAYMDRVQTKFPIAQAERAKQENSTNPEEVELIEKYYQNWGIPEHNRIRPHFTLLYNYNPPREVIEKIIGHIAIPFQSIKITRLAALPIDYWGNALADKVIYSAALAGS